MGKIRHNKNKPKKDAEIIPDEVGLDFVNFFVVF